MFRYLVIDLAAANGMNVASLSGLPVSQSPGLTRQFRMDQEDQDSYQYVDRDDRDGSAHLGPVLRRRRQAPAYGSVSFITDNASIILDPSLQPAYNLLLSLFSPWVALRSRPTEVPARENMTLHHGATTTRSPLTLLSTIKHKRQFT